MSPCTTAFRGERYYTWQSIRYTALDHAPPDIPLSLGDLVGSSFRVFRERFRFVTTVIFWPTVLATVSISGMRWCVLHLLAARDFKIETVAGNVCAILVCLCLLAVAQWELSIRSVTIVRVVLMLDAGEKAAQACARKKKWMALLLYGVAALFPLLVMFFWTALVVGFVFVSRQIPYGQVVSFAFFAVVGLISTCTICWSLLAPALAFTIMACDDSKLSEIFSRAFQLMSRYLWRGGSYIVLLTVVLFAATIAIDLPMIVVTLVDSWQSNFSPEHELPVHLEIFGAFVDSVINIILLGVAPIANALYYNDLCMRAEGKDITQKIEALKRSYVES